MGDPAFLVKATPAGDQTSAEPGRPVLAGLVEQTNIRTERLVDIAKTEPGQNQEAEQLPCHEKRDVEPGGLSVDWFVYPGGPGRDSGQQRQ